MDPRKEKRFLRKARVNHLVQQAYYEGQYAEQFFGRNLPLRYRTNPYPHGRRHNEFARGKRGE